MTGDAVEAIIRPAGERRINPRRRGRWSDSIASAAAAALLAAPLVLLPAAIAAGAELKLATWNLEWMTDRAQGDPALPPDVQPKPAEAVARLARYAAALDADIVALQEVDGPAIAARVFAPERYALHFTADAVVQRVGFAVRRGLRFAANPDLTALDPDPEAAHHLRSGADITLELPGGAALRLLAVHLKSGCREERLGGSTRPACLALGAQIPALAGWVAERRAEGVPFMLLGDFNRWMDGQDALLGALARAAPLLRATEGRASPCWGGGNFIDHLLAGGAARDWMRPETLRVMVYRETGAEWRERLSDHCPVSVRLRIPE